MARFSTLLLTMISSTTLLVAQESLDVHPQTIRLSSNARSMRVVVSARRPDVSIDRAVDVTRSARLASDDPKVARVVDARVVAVANGKTTLRVRAGGAEAAVPVEVEDLERPAPASLRYGTLVALTKQGCNSGGCHGAPSGKGGFRMSLFAYDSALDTDTLTREYGQRRVDVFDPDRSLLLQKPLGRVPHGGGVRLRTSDPAYALLRQWIVEGCRVDAADAPSCERLEVFPASRTLTHPETRQQLLALAHFSDGSIRDVTDVATYLSSDGTRATIDASGLVSASASGQIAVLVQYLELAETSRLTFIPDVPGFRWNDPGENNYIDRHVFAKLREMRIAPSKLCSDPEFVRRVHIDLLGRLPTVEETRRFVGSDDSDKRDALIDDLLRRPGFAVFWATRWGDLLRLNKKTMTSGSVHKLHAWLVRSMAENVPYDDFVRTIVTAQGNTGENPPANYFRTAKVTDDCTETTAQVFLGIRIQCAKCHNHPYERWTQDNYYGLGAFFNRVERTSLPDKETLVWVARSGEVKQPRTGRTVKPWLPGTGDVDVPPDSDRREALAAWLVAPDNPYLAPVQANRVWSHLMGRGIVEPIDDFRASNPPSNPTLLDALAKDFVDSGWDHRHLIRTILRSRAYQLESAANEWNSGDSTYFSHARTRLLAAEQLLNAVSQVTGVAERFDGLPETTLATELPSPEFGKDFLRVFGKPARNTVCECERSQSSDLSRVLELVNGDLVASKVTDSDNRIRRLVKAGEDDRSIVTRLYLAAYSRTPTPGELEIAVRYVAASPSRLEGLEDLTWSILNSKEFLFQH